ncbi:MAG: hypothetical protein P1V51_05970 [Deltaproteobacteria bacterium]|nr:hypothetical protein [Deltaproteobacteria bacterium]
MRLAASTKIVLLALLVASAPGCYRVELGEQARGELERVVVVVGNDPVPTQLETVRLQEASGEGATRPWCVHSMVREELLRGLAVTGWQLEAVGEHWSFPTGALLDAAWPDTVCERAVAPRAADAVLWAVPHTTWTGRTAGGELQIDLVAHLIGCPERELLWRDRAVGRATIWFGRGLGPEGFGTTRAYLREEEVRAVIAERVGRLMRSLLGAEEAAPAQAPREPGPEGEKGEVEVAGEAAHLVRRAPPILPELPEVSVRSPGVLEPVE